MLKTVSYILAGIHFIFLKNALDQTRKAFDTKCGPQGKDWESSFEARQVLVLLCKLIALMLA